METERTLIYIPVLHSPADMGSLASSASPSGDYGIQVERYWERIGAELRALRRMWRGARPRVYQDGLPDAGAGIVARVVAELDSPNYRLLRWLVGQGAVVVGSEDPVLLQEEYELLKASVADEAARRVYAARAAQLLEGRDRYIAARIHSTLPPGGTGILFIGLQHQVVQALPQDIAVRSLRCCREFLAAVPDFGRRAGTQQGESRGGNRT